MCAGLAITAESEACPQSNAYGRRGGRSVEGRIMWKDVEPACEVKTRLQHVTVGHMQAAHEAQNKQRHRHPGGPWQLLLPMLS